VDFPVADVLRGIEAAREAGLGPIKINMVVKRGTNEHQILPMARHFRGTGVVLRFIEYMDVGATNGWRMDEVLPSAEVVKTIHRELPLVQLDPAAPGETAERWVYLCLFATQGHDLKPLVRGSASDAELASAIAAVWQGRSDRYSELRASLPPDESTGQRRVEMSYIGG
jgi:cyclic pyranopterin phosphate synthase